MILTSSSIFTNLATPSVQPISTRDIGTEMTPIPSQDPSRTCTPLDSITPTRSPNSSIPSTPYGEKVDTNTANTIDPQPCLKRKGSIRELSENELKIRTRKEIAALGVQLGKMKIASWASKGEMEMESSNISPKNKNESEDAMKRDYETHAAAWQDAENSRHDARYSFIQTVNFQMVPNTSSVQVLVLSFLSFFLLFFSLVYVHLSVN